MLDAMRGGILKVHQAIYEATRGWIGHRLIGVTTLLLRTTGRRTGQTRTSALVYAMDGGRYIVVGSKGGADTSPGWIFNAKANPDVEIQIGRRHLKGEAAVISVGDPDYDRLWALVNQRNGNRYNAYQGKTSRPIPLLAVTPTS
jgi:deazaflavin-dependent oxidoreductase (nitroreductase family)